MDTDVFICNNCNLELGDRKQAIEHLKTIHKLETTKGTRQMTLHVDGTNFFESQYTWTFGEVQLIECCHNERTAKTRMFD